MFDISWTEFLLIGVVALVFLIKGAGRFSVDHALGKEL